MSGSHLSSELDLIDSCSYIIAHSPYKGQDICYNTGLKTVINPKYF